MLSRNSAIFRNCDFRPPQERRRLVHEFGQHEFGQPESAAPAQLNRTAAALSWRLWFKAAAILQRRQVLSVRAVMMPTEDKHIRTNFATVILSLCHKKCCVDGWGCCVYSAGKAVRAPSVAAHSMLLIINC